MNPHEQSAREAKCKAIVREVLADAVRVLTRDIKDEDMWAGLSRAAGVNLPSEASRQRVIEIIGAAEQLRAAQEQAKRDAEAAAQRERERVEKERKAEDDARAKREANAKLRAKIRADIIEDISEKSANEITDAIMAGKVRHVCVAF